METLIIEQIKSATENQNTELIQRLYELGLYPGLEIQIVGRVSFGAVVIIEYAGTRIALNEEEFQCLRGR